jgi:hypothetical protein
MQILRGENNIEWNMKYPHASIAYPNKHYVFKCKAPPINMFCEDHDYHLGVLKDDPMRGWGM